MADKAKSSAVKSAERTMAILRFLATRARPVSAMTIARECDLPKSSAYHLLNVMLGQDFVTHYPHDRTWGLGVAVFEIGSAYLRSDPIERLARPILAQLVDEVGDTAHLGVLHGNEVMYLSKRQSARNRLPLVTEVGVRLPAHLTAVGRAILMHLSEAQLRALFPTADSFVLRTGRGPRDRGELLAELARSRERGYAMEDNLTTAGIACIAAPVFDHGGRPEAAIGVTFVSRERGPTSRERLAASVRARAEELSKRLGWREEDRAVS